MVRKIAFVMTIFFFSLPVLAADFTADSHVVSNGQTKEAVFYFAGNKWRMNENTPQGRRATIFRTDTKTLTILWPDSKLYITQPVPDSEYTMLKSLKPGKELQRTRLGKETISGYPTVKYRAKYEFRGKQFTAIEWYSKDLGVAIKSVADDNTRRAELNHIKKIKLSNKIFEVPPDYHPVTKNNLMKIKPK